jgi:Uma2 family endonuclease
MDTTTITDYVIEPPNVEHLTTEDDTPVDNIFSEKQQRLLVDTLFSSNPFGTRAFVASANVGIYYGINKPVVVPDVFLSLDVAYPDNIWEKAHRVYMVWQLGKTPDVVIEIVSNTVGHEGGKKFDIYANMGIRYYVVFDPIRHINKEILNIYELHVGEYYPKENHFFEKLGIGLRIWEGLFEERIEEWLRWCDADGNVLLTGLEGKMIAQQRADKEGLRAENAQKYAKIQEEYAIQEKQRAEYEKQRAEQEKQRSDKLAEKLRAMGINPDEV